MASKLKKTPPAVRSTSSQSYSVSNDIGITTPIKSFRYSLWRQLDTEREILNIDLFWPVDPAKLKEVEYERHAEYLKREMSPIL